MNVSRINNIMISVILPVFNRASTIVNCIDSILASEYHYFELIVVDDGSTDGTAGIIHDYEQKDHRIKYIYQNNAGVSNARNTGIETATGDWIVFCDSDDGFRPDHLSSITRFPMYNPDIIMTGRGCVESYNQDYKISNNYKYIQGKHNIAEWLFGDFDPYNNAIFYCTDKFFLKRILHEKFIRFKDGISFGEDQIFVMTYLQYVDTFLYINEKSYLTFRWPQLSIKDHLGSKLRPFEEYDKCFKENYISLNNFASSAVSEKGKKYAINYLLDRYVTRIMYRYLSPQYNTRNYDISSYFKSVVMPLYLTHKKDLKYVKSKTVRNYIRIMLIPHCGLSISMVLCKLHMSFRYTAVLILQRIKRLFYR